MSYNVTGFIARSGHADLICVAYPQLKAASLEQSLKLFPLTTEILESFHFSSESHKFVGFYRLSKTLFTFLMSLSTDSPVLYFEAEYFGGAGEQSALVLYERKVVYGPRRDKIGPISEGLRTMGIHTRTGDFDEFESVGLGRHRSGEEWLASS